MNNLITYSPERLLLLAGRHRSSAEYFRKSAYITTEENLIELFNRLATEREHFAQQLEALLSGNPLSKMSGKKPLGHLGKVWRKMKTALIINLRARIIENVRQTEKSALKRTRRLLESENLPTSVLIILEQHRNELESSVQQLRNERKRAKYRTARAA